MTQFPKSKMDKEVWDYLGSRYTINFINYMIDSKYRKSIRLSTWLNEQVILDKLDQDLCDDVMMNVFYSIRMDIRYKSDNLVWNMNEYWQTGKETESRGSGDCEDGAILMYLEARKAGVPANRLMIMCGDVLLPNSDKTVGHCWLAYRSDGNPMTWEFLDWCYYFDPNHIGDRQQYEIIGKQIYDYRNRYKTLWFGFNENKSHSELKWNYGI